MTRAASKSNKPFILPLAFSFSLFAPLATILVLGVLAYAAAPAGRAEVASYSVMAPIIFATNFPSHAVLTACFRLGTFLRARWSNVAGGKRQTMRVMCGRGRTAANNRERSRRNAPACKFALDHSGSSEIGIGELHSGSEAG